MKGVHIILTSLFISLGTFAQSNLKNDLFVLCKAQDTLLSDSSNNKNLMNIEHQSKFNKINPVYGVLKISMYIYQNVISPQISADCIYHQSCSNFSKSAIKEFGILKGVLLTGDRLCRCIPSALQENEPYLLDEKGKLLDPLFLYSRKFKIK